MDLTYAKYLKIDSLLNTQQPLSDPVEHDEMLFIIIHQVFELWFKQMLWELDEIKARFSAGDVWGAITTFQRVRTIMKTVVGQLDILETMTPISFSAFRARLDTSSGFQSAQFRELEFTLGYKRSGILEHLEQGTPGYERAQRRLGEPSVVDTFYDLLEQLGVGVPAKLREKDPRSSTQPDDEVQDGLLRLYCKKQEASILFELMLDVDEGLQEWRYRHVKIVERTIGSKRGTGGSLGVEFLKKSLFHPVFPDLWAIRHKM